MKKLWTSPFVLFLREAIMLYFSRRVPQAAACLAYFVLLTVFPVLICVSYILGMVNIDIVSLMDQLQPLLPEAALDVLESYLRYISFHQTPGLFLAGLAGCWFSAAAAFRTITRVIIDMYEDVSQSMVRGMVASILFPLGLLVTVDLSVIVVVTGQRTLAAVAQGRTPADTVITGARLVNVCTAEVQDGIDVAIAEGRIAYVGQSAAHCIGESTRVIDAAGQVIAPVSWTVTSMWSHR